MRSLSSSALALCVALATAPARAGPPRLPDAPEESAPVPQDDEAALELAEKAWLEGSWTEVRRILEPVAEDETRLQDPIVREKALLYLADATVQDASLDTETRREQASAYLNRILDADSTWQLQRGAYSQTLYQLYRDVLDERAKEAARACGASLEACRADLEESRVQFNELNREHAELQREHGEQEVEVRQQVARSRALALIPFGVGHFYNGDPALGGTFLAAEVAFGVTGLGLLLHRVIGLGCTRRAGFQTGSLTCEAQGDAPINEQERTVRRFRQAEEAMAWFFLGTVALDVVLAQIRFKPFETTSVRRVKRKELKEGGALPPEPKRKRRQRNKRRAKVRPAPAMIPSGGGLGVHVRF